MCILTTEKKQGERYLITTLWNDYMKQLFKNAFQNLIVKYTPYYKA